LLGVVGQSMPGGGELDIAPDSDQQGNAGFAFELTELDGHRRGAEIKGHCDVGDGASSPQLSEKSKPTQFHTSDYPIVFVVESSLDSMNDQCQCGVVTISAAQCVPLLAAPALMVAASLSERRWGSQAAGLVAAAPVTVLVGVVLVSFDLGPQAARDLALSTSGHVLSQVAMAHVFFHVATRRGTLRGLVFATATYVVFVWLTTYLTPTLAVVLGLMAALAGSGQLGHSEAESNNLATGSVSDSLVLAVRAAVALAAASGIFAASHLFGPSMGGAVGAFPMFSITLACLIASTKGLPGLRNVLRGLVRALPAYQAFGVTYCLTAPTAGLPGGLVAATITCCLTYNATSQDRHPGPVGGGATRMPSPIGRAP